MQFHFTRDVLTIVECIKLTMRGYGNLYLVIYLIFIDAAIICDIHTTMRLIYTYLSNSKLTDQKTLGI